MSGQHDGAADTQQDTDAEPTDNRGLAASIATLLLSLPALGMLTTTEVLQFSQQCQYLGAPAC